MAIYLSIFFLIIFANLLPFLKKRSELTYYVLSIILSLIAGYRYEIGTDYETYVQIFNQIPTINRIFSSSPFLEPGFYYLASIIKSLGLNSPAFFFATSIITFHILRIAIKRLGYTNLIEPLLVYFCFFYFSFHMNVVRHGIMASFVWLAFTYIPEKNFRLFLLYIVIGISFHISAIIFIPTYWILNINIKLKNLRLIIPIAIIVSFLPIFQIISSLVPSTTVIGLQLDYYLNVYYAGSVSNYGITIGFIINSVILLFLLVNKSIISKNMENSNIIINSLLFGLLILLALNKYGVFVERFASVFYLSLILLIPTIVTLFKNGISRVLVYLLIFAYLTAVFYKNTHVIERTGEYQYIPYRTVKSK